MRTTLRRSLVVGIFFLLLGGGARPGGAAPPAPSVAGGSAASWAYSTLGSGTGFGGLVVADAGGVAEVYVSANFGSNWAAFRYDAAAHDYRQVFVSPSLGGSWLSVGIRTIAVGNVTGGPAAEIVVAHSSGQVLVYDQASKALVATIPTVSGLVGLALGDVSGDAAKELVVTTANDLYVYSGAGALLWSLPAAGGYDVVAAQMDADPAIELLASSGWVVDSAARATQWKLPGGQAFEIEAADIDGDGMSEVVTWGNYPRVSAFDVNVQAQKWQLPEGSAAGNLALGDLDGDAVPETIVCNTQSFEIVAYDSVTLAVDGVQDLHPYRFVTDMATGDPDGDGSVDLLWNTGYSDTGPDHIVMADWSSRAVEWANVQYDGPFRGPEIGDLDGDGRPELVTASATSDSGYGRGLVMVFDAETRRLRAAMPAAFGTSFIQIHDVRLRDVDGDGRLEILVGAEDGYRGYIEVYDFDAPDTLTLVWTLNHSTLFGFHSIDAADVDGDGQIEVVVASIGYLVVYDYATHAEEWQSLYMHSYWMTGLEIADLDGDGALEMAVLGRDADVYVFDGESKELEAVLFGPLTALSLDRSVTPPAIVVGNGAGELVRYAFTTTPDPYPYVEIARHDVAPAAVDGVTYDGAGRAWVGAGGSLRLFDAAAAPLWSSENYGAGFGARTAFLPGSDDVFTAGPYALAGFNTPSPGPARTPGVYFPAFGHFFLRNLNVPGAADLSFAYGPAGAGWRPLAGNWDATGGESVGLYDPASGFFFLRNQNAAGPADVVFGYGPGGAGWVPLAGDWDGDGDDTVGLYDPASGFFFLRNQNAAGPADVVFGYGPGGVGWQPVVGDWDGDGVDTVGLYDPAGGFFFLRNQNAPGAADAAFGFGPAGSGWVPLAGDWDADGADGVGLYAPATGTFFLRDLAAPGPADAYFTFGPAGATPLPGDWDGR